jgi:hypothetical protein
MLLRAILHNVNSYACLTEEIITFFSYAKQPHGSTAYLDGVSVTFCTNMLTESWQLGMHEYVMFISTSSVNTDESLKIQRRKKLQ